MGVPNRQIGWSQESNLLWEITKQMDRLTKVVSASSAPTSSYKVYTALLYQDGGNPPTATVLENTLGVDITWTRVGTGQYTAAYDPLGDCALNLDKVFLMVGRQTQDSAPTGGNVSYAGYFGCTFTIQTVNTDEPPIPSDGVLWQTPIEIRFYN